MKARRGYCWRVEYVMDVRDPSSGEVASRRITMNAANREDARWLKRNALFLGARSAEVVLSSPFDLADSRVVR